MCAVLESEESREPRGGRESPSGSHRAQGEGSPLQTLRGRGPPGRAAVLGSIHALRLDARTSAASLIFRRYLEGKGIAKICQELNRDGYRTKTGRAWASQTIANILSNPVYCGLARLNGGIKRGKHEPLIEIDTFNRVQNEMQRRIRRPDQRKAQPPQLRLEDYSP